MNKFIDWLMSKVMVVPPLVLWLMAYAIALSLTWLLVPAHDHSHCEDHYHEQE